MKNREIKFRVWDLQQKIWRNYFNLDIVNWIINDNLDPKFFRIQQFTGLLDSKGKEIYEGDILEFQYLTSSKTITERFKVVFLENTESNDSAFAGYYLVDNKGNIDNCWVISEMTIVGNIFETPNLLNNKK